MLKIGKALERASGDHLMALEWFRDHAGQKVTWSEMQDFSENSVRIINQAKGIYKPAYTDYSLCVRQRWADRMQISRLNTEVMGVGGSSIIRRTKRPLIVTRRQQTAV